MINLKRSFNLLIFFLFFLVSSTISAQTAELKGVVIDKKNKETIIGANVVLKGTTTGASTNLDGSYHLRNIAPGVYDVLCTFISYKTVEITGVRFNPGQIINLDFEMELEVSAIEGVTVTARRSTDTEISLISSIRQSDLVVSGISAEQISRSQDGDAAQVVKRIPGVTISDNRFIMIRGLSERYNAVMLHDVFAPSMEADVRSFSFDIVPSGLIDRILIFKSPSAELPGDFSGGVVKVYTKNIPDENSTSIGFSTTYKPGRTFKEHFGAETGKFYFSGFNNGYYNLPDRFPNDVRDVSNKPERLDEVGKSLQNSWLPQKKTMHPDQSFSVNMHRRFLVRGKRAGMISSISYSNGKNHHVVDRKDYNSYDLENKVKSLIFGFDDHRYTQNIRLGILSNWSIMLNPNHNIDFKNLYNQLSSSEYIHRKGMHYDFGYYANNHSFYQIYRGIYSGQLTGKHKFTESSTTDWILGYGFSYRDEPDYRRFRSDLDTISGHSTLYVPFGTAQAYFLGRFFSQMREDNYTIAFNHLHEINIKNANFKPTIRAGFFSDYKARSFIARNIGYVRSSLINFDNSLLDVGIDSLFHSDNINQGTGIMIDEQTNPSDSYIASNRLIAGYASLALPFTKKINLNIGVRLEDNIQTLNSYTLTNDPINVELKDFSALPSANLSYNINEKMLVRTTYGKTLNKPEFRELAPFGFYDFNFNLVRKGSDSIRMAEAHNYDLRWEYYPSPREMITIGVFYKRFINPIENSFVPGGGSGGIKTFTFANANAANNRGIEAEIRKSLDGLTPYRHIDNLSLLFNAAFIDSRVDLGSAGLGQSIDHRIMFGQSPYIINAGLFYYDMPMNLHINVQYNIIGPRIIIIGYDDYPDLYEMPRHLLDLSVSKTFAFRYEFKFGIGNILNQDFKIMQDANRDGVFDMEEDHVMQMYTPGTTYSLGFSYKF